MGWTDRDGRPVDVPEPPPQGSHYAAIGDFQGALYERNAFALGTAAEVAFLVEALNLEPGARVLDAGCGTGRHTRALVERGIDAVGVDVSAGLLDHAQRVLPGRWCRADVRRLPLRDGAVDAVLCLCQGGFSIEPQGDRRTLAELARVTRRGGRVAVTAFSRAFAERFLAPGDAIDRDRGIVHTSAEVRGADGEQRTYDLWTACYTAAELEAAGVRAGLELAEVTGVEPGRYGHTAPIRTDPELLALFSKQ